MKPTNFKQTCKYNKIMTSKEEIENIIPKTEYGLSYNYDDGFVDGYTQCQQDMADYIFEVAREFHRLGKYSGTISDTHFTDIYEETINSLNKQDNDK